MVLPQRVLKLWGRQLEEWTQRPWCGGATQISQQIVKVSSFWASLWAIQSSCLVSSSRRHRTLLDRIPAMQDLQSAWVLLSCCASSKGQFLDEDDKPRKAFAQEHDRGIWRCLCQLLHVDPESVSPSAAAPSLPLSSGGLGLRSARRLRGDARWASWADSLKMVFDRHPDIAKRIVRGLQGHHPAPSIQAVLDCPSSLTRDGYRPPPWEDLMHQEPEPSRDNAEPRPTEKRNGRRGQRNQLTHVASDTLLRPS